MEKGIYIDKKLYDGINCISLYNKNEQIMVAGGITYGKGVFIDRGNFKWFTKEDMSFQNKESASININKLFSTFLELKNNGMDTVIMIHSHPCEELIDHLAFSVLSDDDIKTSKKLLSFCKENEMNYLDGISTGIITYFWSIDNSEQMPQQVDCYIDGHRMNTKYATLLEGLSESISRFR